MADYKKLFEGKTTSPATHGIDQENPGWSTRLPEFANAIKASIYDSHEVIIFFDHDTDGLTSAIAMRDALAIINPRCDVTVVPLSHGPHSKLTPAGEGPLNTFLEIRQGPKTIVFLDTCSMDLANKTRVFPVCCKKSCFAIDEHPKEDDKVVAENCQLLHRIHPEGAQDGARERMLSTAGLVLFLVKQLFEDIDRTALEDHNLKSILRHVVFTRKMDEWLCVYVVCLSIACYADCGYKKYHDSEISDLTKVPALPSGDSNSYHIQGSAFENKLVLMHAIGLLQEAQEADITGHCLFQDANPTSLLHLDKENNPDWWDDVRSNTQGIAEYYAQISQFWKTQFGDHSLWQKCENVIDDAQQKGWQRGQITVYMFDVASALHGVTSNDLPLYKLVYPTQVMPFLKGFGKKIREMREGGGDVFGESGLNERLKQRDVFFAFPGDTPAIENSTSVMTNISVRRCGPFAGTDNAIDYSLPYSVTAAIAGPGCVGVMGSRGKPPASGGVVKVKRLPGSCFWIDYPDQQSMWNEMWRDQKASISNTK